MNLMPWIYGFVICQLSIGTWLFSWVTVKVTMWFIWIDLIYIDNLGNENCRKFWNKFVVCQPSNWGDNCSNFWNIDTNAET